MGYSGERKCNRNVNQKQIKTIAFVVCIVKVPMTRVIKFFKNTFSPSENTSERELSKQERLIGPMTILRGTLSSLGNMGKRAQPAVGPLSYLSDEACDRFPVG